MKTQRVFIDDVDVIDRMRAVDKDRVAALAESMKTLGLRTPVSVWSPDASTMRLVAGLHRLEAARSLGWEMIEAIVIEGDEIDRDLWEIAENLHRADLTKEERDRHIRRYAELLKAREEREAEKSKVGQSVPLSTGRGNKGIARKIADETGLSKKTIQRALNPQPPKPQSPPREPLNEFESIDRQVDRLMAAWNAAGPEAREQFLSRIERPVFESTRAGKAA